MFAIVVLTRIVVVVISWIMSNNSHYCGFRIGIHGLCLLWSGLITMTTKKKDHPCLSHAMYVFPYPLSALLRISVISISSPGCRLVSFCCAFDGNLFCRFCRNDFPLHSMSWNSWEFFCFFQKIFYILQWKCLLFLKIIDRQQASLKRLTGEGESEMRWGC